MPEFISRPSRLALWNCLGPAALTLFLILAVTTRISAEEADIREIIQLHPHPRPALDDVRVAFFDTATGKYRAESELSDIWMRLSSSSGDINQIVSQPNLASADRQMRLFTVELFSVVNGRLHSDSTGSCSGWFHDVSWCSYGCDGQGFELQRVTMQFPIQMNILLASKAPERKDDGSLFGRGPLPLTLCGADENGIELLVVPAKGKATAEIKLAFTGEDR